MIGFITGDEQIDNGHNVKQKSIPEMFPEYNFVVSTTIFERKDTLLKRIRAISVYVCMGSAIFSIIAFIAIGHWHPDGYIAFNVFVISILLGLLLFFVTTTRISKLKKLYSMSYYIQSFEKCKEDKYQYSFIISSNRKWGLIDNNLKILIQPQYDSMKWVKKDKLIEVNLGQESFLIDIKNNRYI